jgi:hypothetical protein
MLFYSGFGLDSFIQYLVLFRVWFREGLYRMLFYSGFGLEKVYTVFLYKPSLNQTLNKTVSCINLSKPNPE